VAKAHASTSAAGPRGAPLGRTGPDRASASPSDPRSAAGRRWYPAGVRPRLPVLLLAVSLACTRAGEDGQADAEALRAVTEELAAARAAFEADRAAMQQELAELRKAVAGIDAKLAERQLPRVPVPSPVDPALEPTPPELPMSVEPAPPPTFEEDPLYTLVRCESEVRCKIARTYWDELLTNPATLAKQSRIVPHLAPDGTTAGYKLYGIRRGSLPKALGLKNGDLVRSLDGQALGSLDRSLEIYAKIRRKETFTVEIERRAAALTLTVEIVDHV
jgi:hypothetical protein